MPRVNRVENVRYVPKMPKRSEAAHSSKALKKGKTYTIVR